MEDQGAKVRIFDSWITQYNSATSLDQVLSGVRGVVIVTDHDDMVARLGQADLAALGVEVVIDGRNCLSAEHLTKQGVVNRVIGRR